MLPPARLQWWTQERSDTLQDRECQYELSCEIPEQWELKFWLRPLGVYVTEINQ